MGTALKATVLVGLAPGLKQGLCLCSGANRDIPLAEVLGLGDSGSISKRPSSLPQVQPCSLFTHGKAALNGCGPDINRNEALVHGRVEQDLPCYLLHHV